MRPWKKSDFHPFAVMNADTEVMRYFSSILSEMESNSLAEKIQSRLEKNGWGLWALETRTDSSFIGFTGLNQPDANMPPSPCVEIGWRLASPFWGKGFATEAGTECLRFAFQQLQLEKIVSFTATINTPSIAVMRRLGMVNTKHNFLHPNIDKKSPLCQHVLFEITNNKFKEQYAQFREK